MGAILDGMYEPGQRVACQLAGGEWTELVVLKRGPFMGRDFLVVWVCEEADWVEHGEDADGVPWPAEFVAVLPAGESTP